MNTCQVAYFQSDGSHCDHESGHGHGINSKPVFLESFTGQSFVTVRKIRRLL